MRFDNIRFGEHKLSIVLVLSLLLVAGCATTAPTTYYWGRYEKLLHDMYVSPGKATPEVQIEKLSADIQRAEQLGKPVPPGVYAHLGFMYSMQGNQPAAEAAFESEMSLHPDSKVMLQGMLKRANGANLSSQESSL